jgi:hypothetical protein
MNEDMGTFYTTRIESLEQLARDADALLKKYHATMKSQSHPLRAPILAMIEKWQEQYEEKVGYSQQDR